MKEDSQVLLRFNEKVFLVEDNRDNADLIDDFLSDSYAVTSFEDRPTLLSYLEQRNITLPDIFLLDISLPGMDGVELLRTIRESDRFEKIPSIAVTAHALVGDELRFVEAGFDGYVSKPIADEELLRDEIERLLSGDGGTGETENAKDFGSDIPSQELPVKASLEHS